MPNKEEAEEFQPDGKEIKFQEEIQPKQISINKTPKVGEFWRVGNREGNYLFIVVESTSEEEPDVIGVKFFRASQKTNKHFKNEQTYTISTNDLDKKVSPPNVNVHGRRTFYTFEETEVNMV